MTINKKNLRLWIEDLRTTDARQAYGQLNDGKGGFCCLGRLCEVAIANGVAVEKGVDRGFITYDGRSGLLPPAVVRWIGRSIPVGLHDGQEQDVVNLNDSGKVSFAEIADALEAQYLQKKVKP